MSWCCAHLILNLGIRFVKLVLSSIDPCFQTSILFLCLVNCFLNSNFSSAWNFFVNLFNIRTIFLSKIIQLFQLFSFPLLFKIMIPSVMTLLISSTRYFTCYSYPVLCYSFKHGSLNDCFELLVFVLLPSLLMITSLRQHLLSWCDGRRSHFTHWR